MMPLEAILTAICGISLGANILQALHAKALRKKPAPTTTAQDLLHDLTRRGRAIVDIQLINPEEIFLRSPRS